MSITKKLFICLSCTDIMTTLIAVLKHILNYHIHSCVILLVLNSVSEVFFGLGMTIFTTISILRLLSFRNPFMQVGVRRIYLILLIETAASSLIIGVSHMGFLNYTDENVMIILQFLISITYSLAISSLLLINLLSYITLRGNIKRGVTISSENKHSGNPNSQTTHERIESSSSNQKNKRKKDAVNTLIIISAFYMVCHSPMCVYLFVAAVNIFQADYKFSNFVSAYQISTFLLFVAMSNNGFNATILILRSKNILEFYKSTNFCSILKFSRGP